MELATITTSLLSGGLAGGCMNVLFNRLSRWRDLRTKFYPELKDIYAAYVIRMEKPEGRYWVTIVGNNPGAEDEQFVDHRAEFINDLVQYNELKEVRVLRKHLLDNMAGGQHTPGALSRLDLAPEERALQACLKTLHKKLRL